MRRIQNPTTIHISDARKNLVDAIARRAVQLSALDEKYWTVIGHGAMGEKAEQLGRKTWAFLRSGFVPNPRVVLAMGFFEDFRGRNKIDQALERGAPAKELRGRLCATLFEERERESNNLRYCQTIQRNAHSRSFFCAWRLQGNRYIRKHILPQQQKR